MQRTPFSTIIPHAGALVLALLTSAPALAAELGEASVRSYIGQQLSADIELVALDASEAGGVQVRPAQVNVYQGANVGMHPALKGMHLSVMRRDGRQFLHVTTLQPIDADHLILFFEIGPPGRQEVRSATLWLQPDPHPAPPPAPVPAAIEAPSASDAALVAARARAARPAPAPRDLAAAITAKHKAPAAGDAVPLPVEAKAPLKTAGAASAACPTRPVNMSSAACAALDAHSAVLVTKLGVLEDKVQKLQQELSGPAAASAASAAASAASSAPAAADGHGQAAEGKEAASAGAHGEASASASASASAEASVPTHTPQKNGRVLPKLKYKKDKDKEKPAETGSGNTALVAGGAAAVVVAGLLGWLAWKRRKAGKSNSPLKIWQGWRRKKAAPAQEPEPAQPLHEVTPESLLEPE